MIAIASKPIRKRRSERAHRCTFRNAYTRFFTRVQYGPNLYAGWFGMAMGLDQFGQRAFGVTCRGVDFRVRVRPEFWKNRYDKLICDCKLMCFDYDWVEGSKCEGRFDGRQFATEGQVVLVKVWFEWSKRKMKERLFTWNGLIDYYKEMAKIQKDAENILRERDTGTVGTAIGIFGLVGSELEMRVLEQLIRGGEPSLNEHNTSIRKNFAKNCKDHCLRVVE